MIIEHIFILLLAVGSIVAATRIWTHFHHEFLVNEGFTGLLYHDGKLAETLAPGCHIRWGKRYRVAWIDTRKTLLQVAGQEVLTADNIGVKLSVVITTQIVDAAKSACATDSHTAHLYSATQTAIRTVVSGMAMADLLTQRIGIGTQLRELIAPQAETFGVQVHTIEVRDVMLPGELRKAFSEVLKAKQEGQAALERARGESAALRNLANAARLIENQPALATLRFLQTLETPHTGRTIVMNDLAALLPAFHVRGSKQSARDPEET